VQSDDWLESCPEVHFWRDKIVLLFLCKHFEPQLQCAKTQNETQMFQILYSSDFSNISKCQAQVSNWFLWWPHLTKLSSPFVFLFSASWIPIFNNSRRRWRKFKFVSSKSFISKFFPSSHNGKKSKFFLFVVVVFFSLYSTPPNTPTPSKIFVFERHSTHTTYLFPSISCRV